MVLYILVLNNLGHFFQVYTYKNWIMGGILSNGFLGTFTYTNHGVNLSYKTIIEWSARLENLLRTG